MVWYQSVSYYFHSPECSNEQTSEAAGEQQPEAYPLWYVEDCFDPRTKLDERFSILATCTHLSAVTPFPALRPVPDPIVQLQWYDEALR